MYTKLAEWVFRNFTLKRVLERDCKKILLPITLIFEFCSQKKIFELSEREQVR